MLSIRRSPHSIFNRRCCRHAASRSLLGIAVATMPITYNMLIKPEATA